MWRPNIGPAEHEARDWWTITFGSNFCESTCIIDKRIIETRVILHVVSLELFFSITKEDMFLGKTKIEMLLSGIPEKNSMLKKVPPKKNVPWKKIPENRPQEKKSLEINVPWKKNPWKNKFLEKGPWTRVSHSSFFHSSML